MNRSKRLLVLVGVLAAVCLAAFAVTRIEEKKEQIKNTDEIVLSLPTESVTALSWEYDGESLSFHRDGVWLYDGDEAFPVSQQAVEDLLAQFQSFGAAFVIEDVTDYGQYGLTQPVCTIHLTAEETDYTVELGDFSSLDAQRYVSIGDGNVYLVKHDPLDEFDAVLRDMIDHDETPAFDAVASLTFSGAEQYTIDYQEDGGNSFRADDVYFTGGLPLDTAKVSAYLRAITSLNPTDYVTYNATDGELADCGLDDPELTVTVDYADEDEAAQRFVLHISRNPEQAGEELEDVTDAYVRVGDSPILYRIDAASYAGLMAASYDDLRHSEVLSAEFADVGQIDVTLDGESYTLACAGDGEERVWTYQGEDLEIEALQTALEALTADRFTDEQPDQKEEIGLQLHLDQEGGPVLSIALYRYDGASCLAVVDGQPFALVERAAAVDLIEAVNAIVLS